MKYNLRHLCESYQPTPALLLNRTLPVSLNSHHCHNYQQNISSAPLHLMAHNYTQKSQKLERVLMDRSDYDNIRQQNLYEDHQIMKMRAEQLRNKIHNQTNISDVVIEKIETSIEQVLEKIKFRASSLNELDVKFQHLRNQHVELINLIREAERINVCRKQQILLDLKKLSPILEENVKKKYDLKQRFSDKCEQTQQKNSQEYSYVTSELENHYESIQKVLKSKIQQKQKLRQKLVEIKTEILNNRTDHEKCIMKLQNRSNNHFYVNNKMLIQIQHIQQHIRKGQQEIDLQKKKMRQNIKQLRETKQSFNLRKIELFQEIYKVHLRIKEKHLHMGQLNLQMEEKIVKDSLWCSKTHSLNSELILLDNHSKHLEITKKTISQFGFENKKNQEHHYESSLQTVIQTNIHNLQSALQQSQKRKKIIENQYEKLLNACETCTTKQLHKTFFNK